MRVHSRSANATAACPRCGTISHHVHSRYRRRPADLPAHGRAVELILLVRRFRCRAMHCPAKIFAERFPPAVTRPHARRTSGCKDRGRVTCPCHSPLADGPVHRHGAKCS
nr:transposase family protein [Maritimibacter sp. 55A14]